MSYNVTSYISELNEKNWSPYKLFVGYSFLFLFLRYQVFNSLFYVLSHISQKVLCKVSFKDYFSFEVCTVLTTCLPPNSQLK